jgi:hypothetical protein
MMTYNVYYLNKPLQNFICNNPTLISTNQETHIFEKSSKSVLVDSTTFDTFVFDRHMRASVLQSKLVFSHKSKYGYANIVYNFLNGLFLSLTHNASYQMEWPDAEPYLDVRLSSFAFNKQPLNTYSRPDGTLVEVYITETASYLYSSWPNKKYLHNITTKIEMNYSILHLDDMRPVFFELACNPMHFDLLQNLGFVSERTISKAKLVYENGSFIEKNDENIETLYHVGFEFAYTVLNHIWRPSQSLQKIINEFVTTYFHGYYVIGLQFRFVYMFSDDQEIDNFIQCALDVTENEMTNHGKIVRWFVTSDNARNLKQLLNNYPNYVVTAQLNSSTHILHEDTGMSFEKSIVENELLSKCDEIIVTGGSTFGFLAAMRSGRMPLYFNGKRNSTNCPRNLFTSQGTRPDIDSGFM